jgi:catalase
MKIKQRVVDMFANVAPELATSIAAGVGAAPPAGVAPGKVVALSPALSQENTKKTAMGRKVAILANDGFCARSVIQMMDALKAAGVASELVGFHMGIVTALDGTQLTAAKDFTTADSVLYDAVYVPGGAQSAAALCASSDARVFVNSALHHAKSIAASDEGVQLLASSDAAAFVSAQGGNAGQLSTQQGVVSIQGAQDMTGFCQDFIHLIAMHRHWARHH